MPLYRPRMSAVLFITKHGSDDLLTLPLRIRRLWIEANDHNHADQAKVTAEWRDAGVDPRLITSGILEVYVGNADERGNWQPNADDLRFIGAVTRASRQAREEEGLSVNIEALDYTTFFLEAKPFGQKGVPDLSQTLQQAWKTIVAQTPRADQLADALTAQGSVDLNTAIGRGVASRFQKLAKVPSKPNTDAWAVWQQCVGMLGLISFFKLDKCIVTTATDYYTAENPPRMIWGKNVLAMHEARDMVRSRKGVGITSYNPLTNSALEAFFPPDPTDPRIAIPKVGAKKGSAAKAALSTKPEYEIFAYPGVTDQQVLATIAQRVYEERSRQELEGIIWTSEMSVDDSQGNPFPLLTLGSGDVVRIEFDQADREALVSIPNEADRVKYLTDRGYSADAAQLLADNAPELSKLQPNFYVKRVTLEFETTEDSGSFRLQLAYANRIQIDGNATTQ